MESIRNGRKRVGQKDAEIQRSHGGEHRRPSSTVPQILVENVVRNFLQKHQELKNIGLSSGSVQQTKTSDAFPERSTMELKGVALSESVAAASQPNKKRRFTKTQEMQWQIRLEELQGFSQIHGHCRVPKPYPQNPSLGGWVNNMRTEFRKRKEGQQASMTAERIVALNNLGFDWVVDHRLFCDDVWKLRLEELREFHQTNGHCRVPFKYPPNPSLGHWVSDMRAGFRKRKQWQQSSMTAERIAALNNIGFDWFNARKMGE